MRQIKTTPHYSKRIGSLPMGCKQCVKGEKTVLFVTGMCPRHCFYCPISEKKWLKDDVYANEWKIDDTADLLKEIELCESKGMGITGGDPLTRVKRTADFIKLTKKKLGKKFHVHLYTPLELVDEKKLKLLYSAGLDEIRFQLDQESEKYWHKLKLAKKFSWDVGVEIPAIPGWLTKAKKMITFIDKNGADFLNINELEISDTNAQKLLERGFKPKNQISYGVKGSEEMALNLLEFCKEKTKLRVHYCTTTLKDKVQLSARIKRRAKNVAKDYDVVTQEGMLVRGVIYHKNLQPSFSYQKKIKSVNKKIIKELQLLRKTLIKTHKIPAVLLTFDKERIRLLTSQKIVDLLAEEIKNNGYFPAIVTEYPTKDHTIVELDPLV